MNVSFDLNFNFVKVHAIGQSTQLQAMDEFWQNQKIKKNVKFNMLHLRWINKLRSLFYETPEACLYFSGTYVVSLAAIFGCSVPRLIAPFFGCVVNVCHLEGRERVVSIAHKLVPSLRIIRHMYRSWFWRSHVRVVPLTYFFGVHLLAPCRPQAISMPKLPLVGLTTFLQESYVPFMNCSVIWI